jgi:hypothetical protein
MSTVGSINIGASVALSTLTSGLGKAGKEVSSFAGSAGGRLAAFESGASKASKAFGDFAGSAISKAKSIIGPLTKIASVAGLVGTAIEAISLKNTFAGLGEVNQAAKGLGVTSGALAELRHAATQTGGTVGDLDSAVGSMTSNVAEAARVIGPASVALNRLGLDAADLVKLSPDKAFTAIADKLSKIQNEGTRAQMAFEIFGESSRKLVPLLGAGKEKLAAFSAEAKRLGVSLSGVDQAKIVAAQAALEKIKTAVQGIGNTIAVALAPYIEAAATQLTDFSVKFQGGGAIAEKVIRGIVQGVAWVIDAIQKAVQSIRSLFITLQEMQGKAISAAGGSGAAIIKEAQAAAAALKAEMAGPSLGDKLASGFDRYLVKVKLVVAAQLLAAKAAEQLGNASGNTVRQMDTGAAAAAHQIAESVMTPLEQYRRELNAIRHAEANKLLSPRQVGMANRNAIEKLNSGPKFGGAHEIGSREARTSILNATTGRMGLDGFRNLEAVGREQVGELRGIRQEINRQAAQGMKQQEMGL